MVFRVPVRSGITGGSSQRFIDQALLLAPGLPADDRGIPQRRECSQTSENKAHEPVEEKINPLKSGLENREAGSQHADRDRQKAEAYPATNRIPWTCHWRINIKRRTSIQKRISLNVVPAVAVRREGG